MLRLMSGNKEGEEMFLARVHKGYRVTIYETVRDFLEIEEGDILRLTIQIARKAIPALSEEEPPEEIEELSPDIVELEPEPEEVSEKGESWGQEHVEPCPEGLDWPLQDIETCQGNHLTTDGKSCEYYKRKWGGNPEACLWKQWRKVGWEDEIEKPEETTETEENDVLLIYCESGVHKPGSIPHEKRDLGDGWAMYTCLSCKKKTPMLISKAEGVLEAEG